MKKIIVSLLLCMPLFIIGCSNGSQGKDALHTYGHQDLALKLEKEPFQSKLPTKMPFKVVDTGFEPSPIEPERERVQSFDFYGDDKEHISLMVVNGGSVSSKAEFEQVESGDFTGEYAVNDSEEKLLKWKDGKKHYRITFYAFTTDTEVTKEDLINTAKSFK